MTRSSLLEDLLELLEPVIVILVLSIFPITLAFIFFLLIVPQLIIQEIALTVLFFMICYTEYKFMILIAKIDNKKVIREYKRYPVTLELMKRNLEEE